MHTHIPSPTLLVVSSKGQIAIPKSFRVAVGLETGARVMLECHDGALAIHPMTHNIRSIFGAGKNLLKKNTKADEEKAIMAMINAEDEKTKTRKRP